VLHNPGQAFWLYPGILVEADHPGVTSANPTNYLYGIENNASAPLSVVFDAAGNVPGGTVVNFTIHVDALNPGCPGLAQTQVQATIAP
jgi:hypothetical protein